MADCKDYTIITALMTRLATITTANQYDTNVASVFIPKKVLAIASYPSILVFFNSSNLDDEGYLTEESTLEVALVYIDGKDDENETDSYIIRLRNVAADIRKCIMADVSLQGQCNYMHIESSTPGIFEDNNNLYEAHITVLKINRSENLYNPYA